MNGFLRSSAFAKAATCLLLASGGGVSAAYAESMKAPDASVTEVQQAKVTVTGVVKDAQGEPIIGASVMEKGTSNGAISDLDGKFSLNVKPGAQLVVSYVGYISKEVKAGKNISVTLEEDNKLINEVVVIGYGTQRKADVTSAVASVKAEDFAGGKIGDAAELIKGKIAGLSVTNSSGDPNAGSSIMLRGVTSLYGSITPLILVDGIEGSLSTVAPENIAEIDVLKDASAAAIYGTRGANGVILITTKSGRRSAKPEVTYQNYFAFSNWTKKADFMDSHDVIMGNTGYTYDGYDTDWLKAISRKAGFKHNHSLSLRGGGENSAYSGNVTYSRDWGILRKSGNIDAKMQLDYTQFMWDDKLKFNFNVLTTRNKYDLNVNAEGYGAYRQALIRNPSSPVYNEDGSYNENFDKLQYYNPVEQQNEYTGDAITKFMQMAGSVTITPIKGWDTKVMMSWGEGTTSTETWTSKDYYTLATQNDVNGYASKREANWIDKNLEITSNYHNQFGLHRVEALVGYSYLYGTTDGFYAGNGNFPTDTYLYNNLGAGTYLTDTSGSHHASMTSTRDDHKLVGFFGRVSYGYADKYNVLASVRREGSSKFGENHKWGTFPSVSAGWTITNEDFMKSTRSWLDNLKLRVGYGVTGREPYSSYLSQTLYSYTDDEGNKNSSVLNMNGEWVTTLTVNQNPNPELKWETSHEWNFGLDFSFLKGRIYGNVDFYIKKTKDLIWSYAVPVPPNLYAYTVANVGDLRNTGIEFMVTALPIKKKDFTWETTLTLSHNSNKLLKLSNQFYETDNFLECGGIGDPISITTHCMEVGHRLGDFWGLKSVGYDENGYVLVEVKDDDGNWTVKPFDTSYNEQANRQRLGNGLPQVYLGWNNTFNYKGFDLNLQFTGQFGYKILNAQRCFYENNSQTYNRLKSAADLHPASVWNEETKTLEPVYNEDGSRKMVKLSSTLGQGFWSDHLENGDFLKLANATLGYTLPLKGAITRYLSKVRLFVSTTNLFCITGYSGIDPEVATDAMAPGIDDRDKYPTTRSYTFGMQINF